MPAPVKGGFFYKLLMSICNKYFGCLNGDALLESVLKSLFVTQGLNICYTDRVDCEYESAFGCHQEVTLRDIFELIIVEDECGKPALNVLMNLICDNLLFITGDAGTKTTNDAETKCVIV